MLILSKGRSQERRTRFGPTFVRQMEQVLGTCLAEGVKVVSNAGGLNPAGLRRQVRRSLTGSGSAPSIAYVEGDDLLPRLDELAAAGIDLRNLDTGESLTDLGAVPVTANAYLGGWGIADALDPGADVVITGRVTDAALVIGPAAAARQWRARLGRARRRRRRRPHHRMRRPGHRRQLRLLRRDPRPVSHRAFRSPRSPTTARPSSPSTRAPAAPSPSAPSPPSCSTRSAARHYLNPDVIVRFDTIALSTTATDRVRVSGGRRSPPRRRPRCRSTSTAATATA